MNAWHFKGSLGVWNRVVGPGLQFFHVDGSTVAITSPTGCAYGTSGPCFASLASLFISEYYDG